MNTTQWLLIIVPVALAYLYFVFRAETTGQVRHWANACGGLFFVPLFLALMPMILLSVHLHAWRKREWATIGGTLVFLLLFTGYGALVFLMRDAPPASQVPPAPRDLPVERDH
jgi:hypothetical protein